MRAPLPRDEKKRLETLHALRILDTEPEPAFDALVKLAAGGCEAEIALISLVDADRQWFKAKVGLDAVQTSRDLAFCAHAILHPGKVFEVPDATRDARFSSNPLVLSEPHIRFYAGVTLSTEDGQCLGTLCVIDRFPRRLSAEQGKTLRALALQASAQLELLRQRGMLQKVILECRDEAMQFDAGKQLFLSVSNGVPFQEALRTYLGCVGDLRPDLRQALETEYRRFPPFTARGSVRDARLIPMRSPADFEEKWREEVLFAVGAAEELATKQRALRVQQNRLGALVENLQEVVFQTDTGGRWTFLNSAWTRLTGFGIEETVGTRCIDALDPAHRPAAEKLLGALCRKPRRRLRREIECRTAAGRKIWIEVSVHPVVLSAADGKQGAIAGLTGTLNDVTRRKEVEHDRNWRAKQTEFRAEISRALEYEETRRELLDRYADTAKRVLGIDSVQIWLAAAGSAVLEIVACAGIPVEQCQIRRKGEGAIGLAWERGVARSESSDDIHGDAALPIRIGKGIAGVVFVFSATHTSERLREPAAFLALQVGRNLEHRLMIRELRDSEARFRNLADSTPVIIWAITAGNGAVWINQEGLRLTGLSAKQLTRWSWRRWIHPGDARACLRIVQRSRRDGTGFQLEYRLLDTTGNYRWMLTCGKRYAGPNGEHAGYIGTAIDTTKQREAAKSQQEAREAAEAANKAKSEFLATVSHEIRTPMNAILGLTEGLLETDLAAGQREHLEMVLSSAVSLLDVIDDVVDFARIEAGKIRRESVVFDLKETLASAVKPLVWRGERKGLEVDFTFSPQLPARLVGDRVSLRQIVINLVSNAIKFTPAGSVKIAVNAAAAPEPADRRCHIVVSVIDTGIGIASDKREKIFKPFTQADNSTMRQYGGTGLGLAICARLAELAEWKIRLESEPGKGTSFFVSAAFNVAGADPIPAKEHGAPVVADRAKKILVAEDNVFNREVISEMLRRLGYRFVIVENGVEAVEAFRRERFDLVLMDLHMPLMDGFEATRLIRDITRSIRVIAVTADTQDPRTRGGGVLFDAVLVKPIRKRDLIDTLNNLDGLDDPAQASPSLPAQASKPFEKISTPFDYDYGFNAAGGIPEQFCALAELFLKHTPVLLQRLDRAIQSEIADEVALHSHSLQGSAASIGGLGLSFSARQLTQAARAHASWLEVETLRATVDSDWKELSSLLVAEITRVGQI